VLFTSGYAADTRVEREELARAGAVLQKPFTPDSLLQKLREVLDQRSALAG
jgi:CheY-like chemotaxis protein